MNKAMVYTQKKKYNEQGNDKFIGEKKTHQQR